MSFFSSIAGPLIGGVASIFGARQQSNAADASAATQMQAGREAASLAAFRPVGLTTRFGQSQFQMGTDQYGNPILTGAGYTASPEIQALQNRLAALYGTSLGQAEQAAGAAAPLGAAAQSLFGLGQQYLGQSPEAIRQRVFSQQQALLEQPRQQEEQRLASSVFGRGRAGLSVGTMGQPELAALASARRQQDLALAAQAEQQAQQQINFGQGLFGAGAGLLGQQYGVQTAALSPFQTQFGVTQALEEAALQPLNIGAQLGGRAASPTGGQALLQGGLAAAQTQLGARQQNIGTGQDLLQSFLGSLNFGQTNPNIYNQNMGVNFTAPNVYG
jgi:hypothetical protein